MDNAEIQRRAAAAREFEHVVGSRTFRVRIPTTHEVQVELLRAGAGQRGHEHAALAIMGRAVLERGIVGWSGVTTADLLPGEDVDVQVAEYAPALVALLLDAQPELERKLTDALTEKTSARNAQIEAARKN
jgi:hypothetical protein